MSRLGIGIVGLIAFVFIAVLLDWHLYVFKRDKFYINKMARICAQAEWAKKDYQECKNGGHGNFCYWALSDLTKLHGECYSANAAIDAERYRQIFLSNR